MRIIITIVKKMDPFTMKSSTYSQWKFGTFSRLKFCPFSKRKFCPFYRWKFCCWLQWYKRAYMNINISVEFNIELIYKQIRLPGIWSRTEILRWDGSQTMTLVLLGNHHDYIIQLEQHNTEGSIVMEQYICAWWHHQMEAFSMLLSPCVGNSPVTGEFPSQKDSNADFDPSLMWFCINC